MNLSIRPAGPGDIPGMVELSALKRSAYEKHQPVFWRRAPDADARQGAFFEAQVRNDRVLCMVAEDPEGLQGFLIAAFVPAPPVYDPGGPTCLIDDFCVRTPSLWGTVGSALLARIREAAKGLQAAQLVVMCGHADVEKNRFLAEEGFGTATEIKVKPL
jgi:hypothetical protein